MFLFALCVLPILGGDEGRRLARGAPDRPRRRGAPGLVGEPLHDRLRHVPEEGRRPPIIGLGGMAGSAGGFLFPILTGRLLDHFKAAGDVTAGYTILFSICAFAYLVSFAIHHVLAPEVRADPGRRRPPERGRRMKPFIHDDFLLETETARELYHGVAKDLPIIDYHCHLSPELMAADHRFRSITEIWLEGDHYKWRAMRANGVAERFCTGDASDWEKFEAWARTVPETPRQPALPLDAHGAAAALRDRRRCSRPATARRVFDRAQRAPEGGRLHGDGPPAAVPGGGRLHDRRPDRLARAARGARRSAATPTPRVYPTWRPDKALLGGGRRGVDAWVGEARAGGAGRRSGRWDALLAALERRHAFFHEMGCRASDHGLETLDAEPCDRRGRRRRSSTGCAPAGPSTPARRGVFRSALLHRLALLDHARGWVQQFHLGALRNNNTRMRQRARARHRLRLDRRRRAGARRSRASSTASTRPTSSRRRSSTT